MEYTAEEFSQALSQLLDGSDYSHDGDYISLNIISNGVAKPTEAAVEAEITNIRSNAATLQSLKDLDIVISRGKEKFAKEDNSFALSEAEEDAVTQKLALRATLV